MKVVDRISNFFAVIFVIVLFSASAVNAFAQAQAQTEAQAQTQMPSQCPRLSEPVATGSALSMTTEDDPTAARAEATISETTEDTLTISLFPSDRRVFLNNLEVGRIEYVEERREPFWSPKSGNPAAAEQIFFYDKNGQVIAMAHYSDASEGSSMIASYRIEDCVGQTIGIYEYEIEKRMLSHHYREHLLTRDGAYKEPAQYSLTFTTEDNEVVARFTAGRLPSRGNSGRPFTVEKPASSPLDLRLLALVNAIKLSYYETQAYRNFMKGVASAMF